jgi:RNA polymerase sigma factor (sigma-70 family)
MYYETAVGAETASQDADESSLDSLPSCRSSAPLGEVELALLETQVATVHRFVAQRVSNFSDAQDIAQQTLLVASAKLATCRGSNPQAWLFSIARNLICDHFRGLDRRRCVEMDEAVQTETEPALQTAAENTQDLCDRRERLRCWVSCISRWLRLEEQIALLLADVHGYRDKESAAELGITVASFKLLLHDARARLRLIGGSYCWFVDGKEPAVPPDPNTSRPSFAHDQCGHCPVGTVDVCQSNASSLNCRRGTRCGLDVPTLLRLRQKLIEIFDLADGAGPESKSHVKHPLLSFYRSGSS